MNARLSTLGQLDWLDLPICSTCGTQTDHLNDIDFESKDTLYKCPICADPRQYIGFQGQAWTSLSRMSAQGSYRNVIKEHIPGQVWTIQTEPKFGIGQRAFLIKDCTSHKVVMWDCITYVDDTTLDFIDQISDGRGLAHMIISHPHYYSTTAVWAALFPEMHLYLASVDFYDWYQRRDVVEAHDTTRVLANQIHLVDSEQTPVKDCPDFTILLLGGHFPGSLVLLCRDVLYVADTIQVAPSGRYNSVEEQRAGVVSVSFLWSYPNMIPLSAEEVRRVCRPVEKIEFDKAFGAFEGFDIWGHAKEKVLSSRDIIIKRLNAT